MAHGSKDALDGRDLSGGNLKLSTTAARIRVGEGLWAIQPSKSSAALAVADVQESAIRRARLGARTGSVPPEQVFDGTLHYTCDHQSRAARCARLEHGFGVCAQSPAGVAIYSRNACRPKEDTRPQPHNA